MSRLSSLSGRLALVTGGSRGIGLAVSENLARSGCRVVVASRSPMSSDALCTFGGTWKQLDVSDSVCVDRLVSEISEEFGDIDILVNAAGCKLDSLLVRSQAAAMEDVVRTNLLGTMYTSKAVCRSMMRGSKSGVIVNIASVVGSSIFERGQSVYGATKSGIVGFTRCMAQEYSGSGIRFGAVLPGFIETSMTDDLSDGRREEILKRVPLGRFGTTKDVANAVRHLVESPQNGRLLVVDGGMSTSS